MPFAEIQCSTGSCNCAILFCSMQVTDNKAMTTVPHKSHSGSVLIGGDAKCNSNEDGMKNDSTLKCNRGSGVLQTLQLSLLRVFRDIQGG